MRSSAVRDLLGGASGMGVLKMEAKRSRAADGLGLISSGQVSSDGVLWRWAIHARYQGL